jgi:hypothetical protein
MSTAEVRSCSHSEQTTAMCDVQTLISEPVGRPLLVYSSMYLALMRGTNLLPPI